MRHSAFLVLLFISLSFLNSCGTIRRASLGVASPMFLEASNGFEKEGNWEYFRVGIPGNLKLIDGLLSVRPDDMNLLVPAIKGYSGYAFVVNETLYLEDKYKDRDDSHHKDQAIINYGKALSYGKHFLSLEGLTLDSIAKQGKTKSGAVAYLNDHLSSGDVTVQAAAYTAQALASLINLQKGDMLLVSYLPVAKALFDWACEKSPNVGHGVCQMFYGSYESSRPRMLGGNPAKGKKIFNKFIADNPHNWLGRVAYLEHYVIPMGNENAYRLQKKELNILSEKHASNLKNSIAEEKRPAFENKRLRIYQATAIKRFKIIKKLEKDIF